MPKIKDLFKQSLIYNLGGASGKFIGILFMPIFTRIFVASEYGIIDLMLTVTTLLAIVMNMGIDNGLGRYYADARDLQDKKLTASTGLYFSLLISLVIAVPLFPYTRIFSSMLFNNAEYSPILTLTLISMPFYVLYTFFLQILKWRLQPVLYALLSVSAIIFQIVLTIQLIVFQKTGLIGIYTARLATVLLFSIIGWLLTRKDYGLMFSAGRLKELLSFGLPFVPFILAHYIMTYSDRYFLKHFHGLDLVGLYGVGYTIASILPFLLMGFEKAWGPFMYSVYREEGSQQKFSKIFDYCLMAVCLVILVISIFAKEIIRIFSTQQYVGAYTAVPLLLVSLAFYFFADYFFSIGMQISKKTSPRIWIGFGAAALNLFLNYLLIPRFQIMGAALATAISYLMICVLFLKISQKYFFVPYQFGKHGLLCLYVAAAISFNHLLAEGQPLIQYLYKITAAICCLLFAYILKLYGEKEITYLKRTISGKLSP